MGMVTSSTPDQPHQVFKSKEHRTICVGAEFRPIVAQNDHHLLILLENKVAGVCVFMYYIYMCLCVCVWGVSYLCKKHKAIVLHKGVLVKTERGRSGLLKGEGRQM